MFDGDVCVGVGWQCWVLTICACLEGVCLTGIGKELAQFECYDTDDGKEYADDGEALHDFRFGNTFLLVVVVDGGHEEWPLLNGHGF